MEKAIVNEEFDPGNYKITWDGTDENSNKVISGIYLYKLAVRFVHDDEEDVVAQMKQNEE